MDETDRFAREISIRFLEVAEAEIGFRESDFAGHVGHQIEWSVESGEGVAIFRWDCLSCGVGARWSLTSRSGPSTSIGF
jgi:hypothetical protein